ncbi:MAG: hypothetical protein Q8M98_07600 [Candidatus Cloacimonadaceae bacterium]|nr:hypothetical protein [Candidatus Cloacimonadaceae bacterium]
MSPGIELLAFDGKIYVRARFKGSFGAGAKHLSTLFSDLSDSLW